MPKLTTPLRTRFELTSNTAIQAIHRAARFLPRFETDLVDMMGFTGQAFRMQADPIRARAAAATAYDWGAVLSEGLRNAGLHCRYRGGPGCMEPDAEYVTEAVDLVQTSIDRGVPAVVWDLFLPEFGVLYGYDDDRSSLYGKDLYQNGTIRYERLGGGATGELFVLVLTGTFPVNRVDALRDMLLAALAHLEERGTGKPPPPFRAGPAGYLAWIEAFRAGNVDPNGNAYLAHQLHDAREFATAFMSRLHHHWGTPASSRDRGIRLLAGEAADCYADTARALRKLRVLFPDPYGGEPNQARQARAAIRLIRYAKSREDQAIERLRGMASLMQGH
ncbi:MAG: hypothetical protein J7639_07950 [Paenibacillaceae bacterium]|nr:hypothetical protein [Paenibacillaceae bacterium]